MSENNTALAKREADVEIVDEHTGELIQMEQTTDRGLSIYEGIAFAPFPEQAQAILQRPIDPARVHIRPDGIVFLPGVEYRRALNAAFGAGGWALRPLDTGRQPGKDVVFYRGALYVLGRFVAEAIGEHEYRASNPNTSYATSIESAKTDCLTRCCKDLGIASDLWDHDYVEQWKRGHAVEVWCTFIGKGDQNGKRKKFFRRPSDPPFEYPWKEGDGGASQSRDDRREEHAQTRQSNQQQGERAKQADGPVSWETHVMTFGKHKGTMLKDIPGEYFAWLKGSWEPKGYTSDRYIEAALEAHFDSGANFEGYDRITADEVDELKALARDGAWDAEVCRDMLRSLWGVSKFAELLAEQYEACRNELTNPPALRWTRDN